MPSMSRLCAVVDRQQCASRLTRSRRRGESQSLRVSESQSLRVSLACGCGLNDRWHQHFASWHAPAMRVQSPATARQGASSGICLLNCEKKTQAEAAKKRRALRKSG